MGKTTFYDKVKSTIGSIAFSVFLWSIGINLDEYIEALIAEIMDDTQGEGDGDNTFDTDSERVAFKSRFSCSCHGCGQLAEYSPKYDSWYCINCNIWLEEKCSDPLCEFCSVRPEMPSETIAKNKT